MIRYYSHVDNDDDVANSSMKKVAMKSCRSTDATKDRRHSRDLCRLPSEKTLYYTSSVVGQMAGTPVELYTILYSSMCMGRVRRGGGQD